MDAAKVVKAFRGHINRNRRRVTIVFLWESLGVITTVPSCGGIVHI